MSATLQTLGVKTEGFVDVIFSGDVDQVGSLPAGAIPSKGDYLELNGPLFRVESRRWILEHGRQVAVALTLRRNYGLEKILENEKDTVTE